MAYSHQWKLQKQLDRCDYEGTVADFARVAWPLKHLGVHLFGGGGAGRPELSGDRILFNGLARCKHPRRDLGEVVPTGNAFGLQGRACSMARGATPTVWHKEKDRTQVTSRTCSGSCAGTDFVLCRAAPTGTEADDEGWYGQSVGTGFKPYDIAVTACLLIAKRRLGRQIKVSSDGTELQWQDARWICERFLGYGQYVKIGVAGGQVRA